MQKLINDNQITRSILPYVMGFMKIALQGESEKKYNILGDIYWKIGFFFGKLNSKKCV